MKSKPRLSSALPVIVHFKSLDSLSDPEYFSPTPTPGDAQTGGHNMAQVNGYMREQTPLNTQDQRPGTGRVISLSRTVGSPDQSPSSDHGAWSSAIGHAGTGKSGRVIERLQGDIDRLHREKQLLKMRHDEMEKANETLNARNQYLQDRNSNHEQSHEAAERQLARKERQLEDLRDELNREKLKTDRAEEQARVANATQEEWRDQASHAKAIAQQKESEYDAIVSCRNMDNDRHQNGLDKIKGSFETLMRQRQEDLEKARRLEIIAEQQRQTIANLEELTKKLSTNFKTYRTEIDTAVSDLRSSAQGNNTALQQKLDDMTETAGRMRWVMNIDGLFNGNPRAQETAPSAVDVLPEEGTVREQPPSPSKSPTRSRHRLLKKSTKSGR